MILECLKEYDRFADKATYKVFCSLLGEYLEYTEESFKEKYGDCEPFGKEIIVEDGYFKVTQFKLIDKD